jgi:hypothetical protein
MTLFPFRRRNSRLRAFHGRQRRGRIIAADLFHGALKSRAGASRVDFFGALRHIRQHAHMAGQHFQKSAGYGQIPPLANAIVNVPS